VRRWKAVQNEAPIDIREYRFKRGCAVRARNNAGADQRRSI
jgi:hypothetical protein